MTFKLTHARYDSAHCLAPGLFRSLKRGDRKKLKLDVKYVRDRERIEFSGPEPLGTDDLRVMQGLIALAAVCGSNGSGIQLRPEPTSEGGKQLRTLLNTEHDAVSMNAVVVKGSFRQLAREIGYTDIDDSRTIRECLERLWKVSVIVERDGQRMGFRILSSYASDDADGRLFVALNPRLANAIIGSGHFLRIDMEEVRALRSDAARLIHQRLHFVDAGKSHRFTLDTLCGYVWPDEANKEAMKKRRQTCRKALEELRALRWNVAEYATGKFCITRPKRDQSTGAPD